MFIPPFFYVVFVIDILEFGYNEGGHQRRTGRAKRTVGCKYHRLELFLTVVNFKNFRKFLIIVLILGCNLGSVFGRVEFCFGFWIKMEL